MATVANKDGFGVVDASMPSNSQRKLLLADGVAEPAVSTRAQIYVDTADGDLKIKFADATVKTIVVDT